MHLGTAELRQWATTKEPTDAQGPSGTGPAHRVREYLLALVAFTALTLAVTWPLVLQLSSSVYGGLGDSLGYIAGLAYQHTFGWSLFGSAHVAYWGAPIGFTQDSVEWLNMQLVFIPAHMLTAVVGPVAAYNILDLAGLALSGLGMYVFCREIGVRVGPSLWAGGVYTIFPGISRPRPDTSPRSRCGASRCSRSPGSAGARSRRCCARSSWACCWPPCY